jgi:anion-transporting  ArsA/GET3 family ATPase
MLASAGSMMELTRAGPVYEGVKKVHELISDPSQTGLVLTCLPEELPVNETIALYTQLRKANHDVSAVVLNETIHMDLPDSASWSQIRPSIAAHPNQSISGLAELTDRWLGQLRHQREARLKLKAVIDAPILDLPMLADRRVGFSELEQLSEILAQHLSTP